MWCPQEICFTKQHDPERKRNPLVPHAHQELQRKSTADNDGKTESAPGHRGDLRADELYQGEPDKNGFRPRTGQLYIRKIDL